MEILPFGTIRFRDRYEVMCHLQDSSMISEKAIWFGVENANPRILDTSSEGWVDYEIPKEVLLDTRMLLTQEQVKELLPILTKFSETGVLPLDNVERIFYD